MLRGRWWIYTRIKAKITFIKTGFEAVMYITSFLWEPFQSFQISGQSSHQERVNAVLQQSFTSCDNNATQIKLLLCWADVSLCGYTYNFTLVELILTRDIKKNYIRVPSRLHCCISFLSGSSTINSEFITFSHLRVASGKNTEIREQMPKKIN